MGMTAEFLQWLLQPTSRTTISPNKETYNQSVMRKHLLVHLENKTMTPFPQQTKRFKRGKEVTHRFP